MTEITMRNADLSEPERASIRAATLRVRDLPLSIHPLVGQHLDEALAAAWQQPPALIVGDYGELLPPYAVSR